MCISIEVRPEPSVEVRATGTSLVMVRSKNTFVVALVTSTGAAPTRTGAALIGTMPEFSTVASKR